jgi:hypothetical protein
MRLARFHHDHADAIGVVLDVTEAGNPFEYVSLPTTPHSFHGADERLYVDTLVDWTAQLSP